MAQEKPKDYWDYVGYNAQRERDNIKPVSYDAYKSRSPDTGQTAPTRMGLNPPNRKNLNYIQPDPIKPWTKADVENAISTVAGPAGLQMAKDGEKSVENAVQSALETGKNIGGFLGETGQQFGQDIANNLQQSGKNIQSGKEVGGYIGAGLQTGYEGLNLGSKAIQTFGRGIDRGIIQPALKWGGELNLGSKIYDATHSDPQTPANHQSPKKTPGSPKSPDVATSKDADSNKNTRVGTSQDQPPIELTQQAYFDRQDQKNGGMSGTGKTRYALNEQGQPIRMDVASGKVGLVPNRITQNNLQPGEKSPMNLRSGLGDAGVGFSAIKAAVDRGDISASDGLDLYRQYNMPEKRANVAAQAAMAAGLNAGDQRYMQAYNEQIKNQGSLDLAQQKQALEQQQYADQESARALASRQAQHQLGLYNNDPEAVAAEQRLNPAKIDVEKLQATRYDESGNKYIDERLVNKRTGETIGGQTAGQKIAAKKALFRQAIEKNPALAKDPEYLNAYLADIESLLEQAG